MQILNSNFYGLFMGEQNNTGGNIICCRPSVAFHNGNYVIDIQDIVVSLSLRFYGLFMGEQTTRAAIGQRCRPAVVVCENGSV